MSKRPFKDRFNRGDRRELGLTGETIRAVIGIVKYDLHGTDEIDYDSITITLESGKTLIFKGGDHGHEDPWVYVEVL